ncbi:leucine-rich repeat-containing protein [Tanacetum coccineum]
MQTFLKLTNLTELGLSYNNFSGEWQLDTLLITLTKLEYLDLSYSGLSVRAKNANHYVNPGFNCLGLASCKLKVFPPSICNMSYLSYLDLSNNSIGGIIPECVIFGSGNLEGLRLNGNQLEGEVPHSLSKCRSLKVLDLGNNKLNGTFPEWLGGLSNLQVLVLKSNNFHGPIGTSTAIEHAFSRLHVLDLSHNSFVGKLPGKYFQNFQAMQKMLSNSTQPDYLYFSVGIYCSIIAMVKDVQMTFTQLLVDYTIVDLSNNKFEGEIPNVIGSLKSLKVLNLSHNNLYGEIPNALGNILGFESLDLSWNQLIGQIPQSLAKMNALAVLNLSQNRLVGRIPQGKQFNTFDESSYGGNLGLCGFPLSNNCEQLSSPHIYGDGDEEEVDESGFTWKVVMLGYGCGTLVGLMMGYLMLSTRKVKWFNAIANATESLVLKKMKKKKRRHIYIGK